MALPLGTVASAPLPLPSFHWVTGALLLRPSAEASNQRVYPSTGGPGGKTVTVTVYSLVVESEAVTT